MAAIKTINNFNSFCTTLIECGFSMGGGNAEGIFAIIPFCWNEEPSFETNICWHTGDPETDPWEWRMRVLDERNDIAYGKVFFNKSGYITKEWYPYFFVVRRNTNSFDEEYSNGNMSIYAKRIYDVISENGSLPLHLIKQLGRFSKEDKSKFDRALTELQMKMYITMCGKAQKVNRMGVEYGWNSTVFCTIEEFWDDDILEKASNISKESAIEKIVKQIYKLNPNADEKKVIKFIKG